MEPISIAKTVSYGAFATKRVADGGDPSIIDLVYLANIGTGFAMLGASEDQSKLIPETAQEVETSHDKKQIVIQGEGVDRIYLTQGPEEIISDVTSTLNDETQKRTILTQQFVAEERYANYGNFLDVAGQIRNGEIPDMGSLFLSVIDVFDYLTLSLLRPYLIQYKLNPHLKAHIQRNITLEYTDVVTQPGMENETDNSVVSREENIEKLGILKQRTSFKETTISSNTEIRTRVEQKSQSSFLVNASEVPGNVPTIQQDHSTPILPEKEQHTKPEQIQASTGLGPNDEFPVINEKALMEQMPDRVKQSVPEDALIKLLNSAQPYAETHHSTIQSITTKSTRTDVETGSQVEHRILGWRLGWLSGINDEGTVTTSTIESFHHAVEQSLENVDLHSVRGSTGSVTPEMVDKLGGKVLREAEIELPDVKNTTIKPGEFNDGLISYAPFVGGIVHVGAKYDLGGSITKGDVFWAAMDAVEIAVLIVTLGVSSPFTALGKTIAKAGIKTTVRAGAKQVGKNVSKLGVKKASKSIAWETGQEFIESRTKKMATKNSMETAVKETGEQAVKKPGGNAVTQEVVQTAVEKTGQQVSKKGVGKASQNISERSVKEVVESTAEKGVKQTVKASSPELGKNLEKAGKSMPAPDHQAHHIVAGNEHSATNARRLLEKFKIDINSADNGVWLPSKEAAGKGTIHNGRHTGKYHAEVERRLKQAKNKEQAQEILQGISDDLANGKIPL